jgi:hypothetical protein
MIGLIYNILGPANFYTILKIIGSKKYVSQFLKILEIKKLKFPTES